MLLLIYWLIFMVCKFIYFYKNVKITNNQQRLFRINQNHPALTKTVNILFIPTATSPRATPWRKFVWTETSLFRQRPGRWR